MMTLGSLFDGIAGFPYAAEKQGIKTLWTSDIESAPCEISKRHFPNEIKDTSRYNALGNSIAVPCAERVFAEIMAICRR